MADVKWIRLSIDMFSNAKIKYLRTLPEGNNIILIWVMLLTIGGRCNSNGFIFLTENVPYNAKILADELGFDESVIVLALNCLAKLNMIQQIDDLISITGWDEHQNSVGLEKIREQNRSRQSRFKERKLLTDNVTNNVTVTLGNATEIELDKEIDKDIKKESKHKFGEFGHVRLKESESERLIKELGKDTFDKCIKRLDEYIQETGKKYKDHNLTIRRWVIDAVKQPNKPHPQQQPKSTNKFNSFPQRQYSQQDYADIEKKLLNKE